MSALENNGEFTVTARTSSPASTAAFTTRLLSTPPENATAIRPSTPAS